MKENKVVKEDEMFPATKSLCDENGEPLLWRLRHISSKEMEDIRERCTYEEEIPGKYGQTRTKVKQKKLQIDIICAAVVEPDLRDSELQDSYGVKSQEDLLMEMIDSPAEFDGMYARVAAMNGFMEGLDKKAEEAKNSSPGQKKTRKQE